MRISATQLDELSGRINGEFAACRLGADPLRQPGLSARRTCRASTAPRDVALITPLRDGMNLVAKEYVASQDPDDPGVLILSRFAGAAHQMPDALLVNPYSKDDVSDAIREALDMPKAERLRRWESLIDGVRTDDVMAWRRAFVGALSGQAQSIPASKDTIVA